MGNIWWEKKWQIMSYSLKFSLPIFTDTSKMYLTYALTVAYLPNFSSPIALIFACTVRQNFPSPNISHVRYYMIEETYGNTNSRMAVKG